MHADLPSRSQHDRHDAAGVAGSFTGVSGWAWPTRSSRSPYVTDQNVTRDQPVPFSHEHHVGGLGLDCRYCHTSVEKARFAGLPPTETCMTCHSQLWTNADMLAPVRESLAENKPIRWQRVNKLPDYVYFDHSIHIAKGVGCTHLPRTDRSDEADPPGRAIDHGMVPRLPSRSGQGDSPARGCFRSRLEAGWRPQQVRTATDCSLSHSYRSFDGLLDMPPMNELPLKGSQFFTRGPAALDRRQALNLLAAGIASGLAGCSKPTEEIIPYVKMPERLVPGEALKFATTLSLSGYGRGVIVTSIDGRPIKVEGNPRHPASLGATDVFAEATVLSLYDPDRSRTILENGKIASPDTFRLALRTQLQRMQQRSGEGFRLLTGRVTSPTLLRQIGDLLQQFPKAAWHAYEPIDEDNAEAGAALAFGRRLRSVPHLDKARVLVTLDADPLGQGPSQLSNARGFAARRHPKDGEFSRIYSIETAPTLTGAKADHRIALRPQLISETAIAIAHVMGAPVRDASLPDQAMRLAKQAAADLSANHGAALVLAAARCHPRSTRWCIGSMPTCRHRSTLSKSINRPAGAEPGTLAELAHDLDAGAVDQLVMIGVNPGYDAAADLEFAKHSAKAAFRVHLGRYADETADLATWHVPQTHELESWSDLRSSDGIASLVQPLIRPLFRSWTDHELLALLTGHGDASAYHLVRETWQLHAANDFEGWWARALHDGVIADRGPAAAAVGTPSLPEISAPASSDKGMTVVLRPDPTLWDGSFANNAWLQECPKPLTKQVWGNALALNPKDAARHALRSGDMVTLSSDGRQIDVSVVVEPGVAEGALSLTLGLGRRKAGAIGNGIGVNAFALRTTAHAWSIPDAKIVKTGQQEEILTTQNVVRTAEDVRELYPLHHLADIARLRPARRAGNSEPDAGEAQAR